VALHDDGRRSHVPCLSIGLPVCNGERYVREAIDSLLAQAFGDFELIIADNASTDGSERICRGYAASDHRIRYVRNATNIGSLGNFNLTFAHARGRYFKWAADDDVVQPEFLARCLEVLEREPAVVLCHSHTRVIDEHGATVGDYAYPPGHGSSLTPSRRFDDVLAEDRWCFELFGVMRADTLRKTKLLAGHVGSDRGLLAELALQGRFAIVPDYLFFSRDHPCRLVRRFPAHHLRAAVENPELAGRRLMPHWRILAEYGRGVRRARLPPSERVRCFIALARWLGRHGNWARLAVDPVIAVAPSTAPFFLRLAASNQRWLGKRAVRPQDRASSIANARCVLGTANSQRDPSASGN
jgi:glycosyltransferase involved in cell wall biosynthesis